MRDYYILFLFNFIYKKIDFNHLLREVRKGLLFNTRIAHTNIFVNKIRKHFFKFLK